MTWDVRLNDDGDLPAATQHITGRDLIPQRARLRIRRFRGDNIFDRTVGIRWIQRLGTKPVDLELIRSDVLREVLDIDGVARVHESDISFDPDTETITMTATLVTADEEEILISEDLPGVPSGQWMPSPESAGAVA